MVSKIFTVMVDGIYANEDWEAAEELFNTAMEQTVGDPEMHARCPKRDGCLLYEVRHAPRGD